MINSMLIILCFGLLIAYWNVFGGIASSIYIDLYNDKVSVLARDNFYILLLGVLILSVIFKRMIKELKIVSIILFMGCIVFITALGL